MNTYWIPSTRFLALSLILLNCGFFPSPAQAQGLESVGYWETRATATELEPRHNHTAIWTGQEMIVWGGEGFMTTFGTGGRYNPGTDQWRLTSPANAPARRTEQRAVWTGSEMIIWGGFGEESPAGAGNGYAYGDGGRYDPQDDSWKPVSTNGSPNFRMGHSVVWTGSEMIVWGGYHGTEWYRGLTDDAYYGDGARYNPATDTWSPVSAQNAPSQRTSHAVVWTGTEMIVWSGYYRRQLLNDGARYNPANDTWTPISAANGPSKNWPFVVWTGTEMIVWGGTDAAGAGLAGGGRYNPTTDTWRPLNMTNEPSKRYSVAQTDSVCAWTGRSIMVWGQFGIPSGFPATGGLYDPTTDSWLATTTQNAPGGRSASLIWTGHEVILFAGWSGRTPLHNETFAFTPTPPLPIITRQPENRTVARNHEVTFTVEATSVSAMSFQWLKDGHAVIGATNAVFTIEQVQLAEAGSYTVIVGNSAGVVASHPALLVVEDIDTAELAVRLYAGLTIIGTVGKSYRIEYEDELQAGNWQAIETITLAASPQLWFDATSAGRPRRFYRAVVVP